MSDIDEMASKYVADNKEIPSELLQVAIDAYKQGLKDSGYSRWISFEDRDPIETGEPKLIVWNKGSERHLGIAWGTVDLFRKDMEMKEGDTLRYWMYLTDPEVQS